MKNYYFKAFLMISIFFSTLNSFAQTKQISGTVTDESGIPMPGVNILVQGTNIGTQTDFDGNYNLEVSQGDILVFSFLGTRTIEQPVTENSEYDVVMTQDQARLDEVVVVGYGTSKVKDLTGSVSRVNEESFNKGVNASPDQLIQGKVAGVNVVNNSGAPGGAVTFRIRGASSVRSGNQPLFVVDGVPLSGANTKPSSTSADGGLGNTSSSNPLNFINPNDIATIDILKDASATAIYGSRGANGVVLITTKKGKIGAPKLTLDYNTGVSEMAKEINIMDSDTFRRALEERDLSDYDGGESVDAYDAITRIGITNVLNLSVSGGSDKGNYRLSAGYHDQEGIIKNTGLTRYSANFKSTYKFLPKDRLKLDLSLIASNTIQESGPITEDSDDLIGAAIEWNPTVPFRYPNGDYVQRIYNANGTNVAGLPTNPLALQEYFNDESNITDILGSFAATFTIINGLDYKFNLGVNQSKGNRTLDTSGELFLNTITDLGEAVVNNSVLSSSTVTHTLNYSKEFEDDYSINALLGYEFQKYKGYRNNISAKGFTLFDILGSNILQNPSQDNINVNSFRDPVNELQSYFGRVNFNLGDRFLLTATMRADGSTKFGANNKYGYFPSAAGAWVLSEEEFLSNVDELVNLKIRAGWGRTGNQEFPSGASQERYEVGRQQIFLTNVANPDLKWETSETVNVGVDFAMFKSRFSGSIDYFNKSTKDLLFQLPTIQPAPAAQFWTNIPATIKNKGLEIMLNGVLKRTDNFNWEIGLNGTILENELKDYSGAPVLTGKISGNGLSSSFSQRLVNNQPLFVFYMQEFQGFGENGQALYSDDLDYVGDPNPNLLLGFNTNIDYKNFSFNMSMNGAFGHQVYNNTANAYLTAANFALGRNTSPDIAFGDSNLSNANLVSTRYLEDADYLRLQNASLSYNFSSLSSDILSNLRVSLTGQNLFLITNYSGFDPEVNTDRGEGGVPSYGIEYSPYPPARIYSIGVTASF